MLDQIVEELLGGWTAPYPIRSQVLIRVEQDLKRSSFAGCVVSRYMLPYVLLGLKGECLLLTQIRLQEVASALERYAVSHDGGFPESLSALVPNFMSSIPVNAADGSPLNYECGALRSEYVLGFAAVDPGVMRAMPEVLTNTLRFVVVKRSKPNRNVKMP